MSEELSKPMQLALEQAWESFRNGSFPVGAVLVDDGGYIVAGFAASILGA